MSTSCCAVDVNIGSERTNIVEIEAIIPVKSASFELAIMNDVVAPRCKMSDYGEIVEYLPDDKCFVLCFFLFAASR